jgi:formylglycine-generating enzyme required for sulfatase activity
MGTNAAEANAALQRHGAKGLQEERLKPEQPEHRVRLTRPFLMGKHEVTVGLFRRFVQATGYRTDAERGGGSQVFNALGNLDWAKKADASWANPGHPQTDAHPVVCVSWNDAQAFLEWLNQADGSRPKGWAYRLPTEAEWEWAARGAERREYPWGNEWDGARANFADKTSGLAWADPDADDGHPRTAPVGSYSPRGDSPFGVCDLTGNVWEWCLDGFDKDYYKASPVDDPVNLKPGTARVERGGSWAFARDYCRAAFRFSLAPDQSYDNLGFRVVLAQDPADRGAQDPLRSALEAAANELVRGPLEEPTEAARQYVAHLVCYPRLAGEGKAVACSIANKGTKDIRQLIVQIDVLDKDGKSLTWHQGPVLRTIRRETGWLVRAAEEETVGGAFSRAEAPLKAGATITFTEQIAAEGIEKKAVGAKLRVMDVTFAAD